MENCNKCGNKIIKILTPESIHYAKYVCSKCYAWYGWVKSPFNEGKRPANKYNPENIMKFHKMDFEPICFFCLRNKNQLGVKETLTIDHIHELDKDGEDIIENMQILCSACHKLKNWARLYINWHIVGGIVNHGDSKTAT
jgi:5-methylcytosine-specific restriction endonuclease McrA